MPRTPPLSAPGKYFRKPETAIPDQAIRMEISSHVVVETMFVNVSGRTIIELASPERRLEDAPRAVADDAAFFMGNP